MLFKKLAIFGIACVLIIAFGMIQGCDKEKNSVNSFSEVTNSDLISFDSTDVMWNIDSLQNLLDINGVAKSSWSVINGRIYCRAIRDLNKYV